MDNHNDIQYLGMAQPGRNWNDANGDYRYGYNGKEEDNEIKANSTENGKSLDYGARWYDPRKARWDAVDPLEAKYPSYSPYMYAANSPNIYIDIDGNDIYLFDKKNTVVMHVITGAPDVGYRLAFNAGEVKKPLVIDVTSQKIPDAIGLKFGASFVPCAGVNYGMDFVYFHSGKDAGTVHAYFEYGGRIGLEAGGQIGSFYAEFNKKILENNPKLADQFSAEGFSGLSFSFSGGLTTPLGTIGADKFWTLDMNSKTDIDIFYPDDSHVLWQGTSMTLGGEIFTQSNSSAGTSNLLGGKGLFGGKFSASWGFSDFRHLGSIGDNIPYVDVLSGGELDKILHREKTETPRSPARSGPTAD